MATTLTESVTSQIPALRAGDQNAQTWIWNRYFNRLISVARSKMVGIRCREADEMDIAITALYDFLKGVTDGSFPRLDDRTDLWQILVMFTGRKAATYRQRHKRQKRGNGAIRWESVFGLRAEGEVWSLISEFVSTDETSESVLELAEQLQIRIELLSDETLKRVAKWKMQGFLNRETAEKLGCQERTVERKLHLIRSIWLREQVILIQTLKSLQKRVQRFDR